MILATSLPKNGYSGKAVLAAYRLRWRIELAFKRLKSLLYIDWLPTWTERGSRSWLYAHLILGLLCDDLSQKTVLLSIGIVIGPFAIADILRPAPSFIDTSQMNRERENPHKLSRPGAILASMCITGLVR